MQLDIHRPRNIDGERKELIRRGRHLKLVVWAGVDMQLIGGIAGDPSVIGWPTFACQVVLVGVT
jgi:hypothetical protein